jgi:hypothetical protein
MRIVPLTGIESQEDSHTVRHKNQKSIELPMNSYRAIVAKNPPRRVRAYTRCCVDGAHVIRSVDRVLLRHCLRCACDTGTWEIATHSWLAAHCALVVFRTFDARPSEGFLKSKRIIGRGGVWWATTLKPTRTKVETYPVPDALGVRSASTGYASKTGAPPAFAIFNAARISADVTPRRR